ncbi:hypothetical protein AN958_01544 [Leucoagaricus sp. SymC.cos]|nr:hypothetical protein AN958_01544 [Leucoagaricus sp. SymC.cos]
MDDLHVQKEIADKIETLSKVADLVDAKDVSFESITSEIDALSDEALLLQLSNNRLAFIEEELISDLASASHELHLITDWKEKLESELASSETPAGLERKREALIRKAKELNQEHQQMMKESQDKPPITITQLLKQKERLAKKEEDLKVKKAKLKAFQGLPPVCVHSIGLFLLSFIVFLGRI